jgi:hypothetical protein
MTRTRKPKRPPTIQQAASQYPKLIERAAAIAPLMDGPPWTVDDVLYVALCAGLDELERRYARKEQP